MFKSILIVMAILLVCSCKDKGNQGSTTTAVKLENDLLIVRDVNNSELELTGEAKDSLSTLLKDKNIFTSGTLWCVIEVNQKAGSIPLPSGVRNDTTAHEIDWGKHYVIWFNSSSEELEVFKRLQKEKDNQTQPFLEIEWDLVVRVNFEKDQLLQASN